MGVAVGGGNVAVGSNVAVKGSTVCVKGSVSDGAAVNVMPGSGVTVGVRVGTLGTQSNSPT